VRLTLQLAAKSLSSGQDLYLRDATGAAIWPERLDPEPFAWNVDAYVLLGKVKRRYKRISDLGTLGTPCRTAGLRLFRR